MITEHNMRNMLSQKWCTIPGIKLLQASLIAVMAIELNLNEESILAVESYILNVQIKKSKNAYFDICIERHIAASILAFSSKLNKTKWVSMAERLGYDIEDLEHLSKKLTRPEPIHRSSSTTLKLLGR